jgi:hypothetical protein
LKTGGISKMQIPQNEKLSLGLLQGYLIFQIYLNSTKSFTIQISISNSMNSKRRLLFSACSKEFVINNYHCRLPLINFPTNTWVNLSIDIISFVNSCFSSENFRSIDFICLSADCKIRKICAMRKNFTDSLNDYFENDESSIPKNFLLPSNINFTNLNIDMNYIQSNIQINNIKENYLNNNINLPLSSQGQRGLSLNNNNNILKNNFKMPNTASEKNRYIGQNLGKNIMNSFGVKSKSLGKVYKIVNGKNDKNEENNNLYEHKLQSANVNKVNLIENAFQGNDYYPIRKLSDNHDKNNNLIVKNLNSVNKSKNWNLYDQNGRRINRNVSHINEIRENNFDLSKTQKPIKSKTPDRSFANTLNHRTSNINNNKNKELKNQTLKLQKTIVKPPLLNNKAIPEVFKFNKIPIKNFNIENQFEDKSKLLGIINYNDDNTLNNVNNNNNASIQEVVDYDQNNTLLKGENNTTRESEKIIYRDKNDNLKILNIRIKDDSIKDSQNKNSNKKDFIEESLKENLLQNINESTTNRPYTPPVSNMIPDDGSDNVNNNNIKKINESIIKNHYNEMVYDKETGKYFNSRTNIYYDLK